MRYLPIIAALAAFDATADDATVGTGTANSCDTTAFFNAVAALGVAGGTLRFNCGPAAHTIVVGGQSVLNGQTTVDGGGLITLDAFNLGRLFLVLPREPGAQTEVTLRNIRLVRGFALSSSGGALLGTSGVTITLDGVTIESSGAGFAGGALAMEPGSTLSIVRSTFRNNYTSAGGVLAISSDTVIEDSYFSLNSAQSQGGAIQSLVANLVVRRSRFESNSALRGGAIYKRNGLLRLEESRFDRNTASIDGGAVYAEANVDQVITYRTNFEGNVASQGAGGAVRSSTEVMLQTSSFDSNRAQVGGALSLSDAIFPRIDDCSFRGNVAALRGGAVDVVNVAERIKVFQASMSENEVQDGPGGDFALQGALAEIELSTLIGGTASAGGPSLHIGSGASAILRGCAIWTSAVPACQIVAPGAIASSGSNVGPGTDCGLTAPTDITVTQFAGLGLGEFGDYGGDTRGYLPSVGSVLVDRFACSGRDQRRAPRPVDGDGNGIAACDAGALERQLVEPGLAMFRSGFE